MNLLAAFMLAPAFLAGSLVWYASGKNDAIALVACGVILLAADLVVRARKRSVRRWLLVAQTGGVVFIFPLWTIGAVQLAAGTATALGVKPAPTASPRPHHAP